MPLELNLVKRDDAPKLQLGLSKGAIFTVETYWDDKTDLDSHALEAKFDGNSAKVTDLGQVLSVYNTKAPERPGASLSLNPDGKSFSTVSGGLMHSGDARDGTLTGVDEIITIDGSKLPAGCDEIPIFVTIHPAGKTKFSEVKEAGIRIKDGSGAVLGEYQLSNQFGEFDVVQLGSLLLDPAQGWQYIAAGAGFKGDFNTILQNFS